MPATTAELPEPSASDPQLQLEQLQQPPSAPRAAAEQFAAIYPESAALFGRLGYVPTTSPSERLATCRKRSSPPAPQFAADPYPNP